MERTLKSRLAVLSVVALLTGTELAEAQVCSKTKNAVEAMNEFSNELALNCTPGIDKKKIVELLRSELGRYTKTLDLSKLSFCMENKNGKVIGCNVNQSMRLLSVTKLMFADFLESDPKRMATKLALRVNECESDHKVHLGGTGYPTVKLDALLKDIHKTAKDVCYESDLLVSPEQSCGFGDGNTVYGKLMNNPKSSAILSDYKSCIAKTMHARHISACGVCSGGRKPIQTSFEVKNVIHTALAKSDSFFIEQIGKLSAKEGGTLGQEFITQKHMSTVDGEGHDQKSCAEVVDTQILKRCDPNLLPNNKESDTWNSYCTASNKEGTVCGKTGSGPSQGVVNFAGCKVTPDGVDRFAVFYDFKDGVYSSQDQLDPIRKKLYGQGGIWSILSNPHLTEQQTENALNH